MKARNLFVAVLLAAGLMSLNAPVMADQAPGNIILTVAGNIAETNRPAFDAFTDSFINYHERKFERAYEFDRDMLRALPQHRISASYKDWPRPLNLSGPAIADILKAVGARGERVEVVALDGYSIEFNRAELEALNWILAIDESGKPMAIGGRGPAWIAHPVEGDRALTEEEESQWVWSIFMIEVH